MNKRIVGVVAIALSQCLVGCVSYVTRAPTISATSAPSPTITLTPTNTPWLTYTPRPTFTHIPTATSSNTPEPIPTIDGSTPAPPSDEWATFTYEKTGLTFQYPANWHIWLDEENYRVVVLNAPPNGIQAIKGGNDDFMRVNVGLTIADISPYTSLRDYIDQKVLINTPAERILSVEEFDNLSQGYQGLKVITSGMGDSISVFIANAENRKMSLSTLVVPGRTPEKVYLYVMDRIARTVVIP